MSTAIIIVNYRTPWHIDQCLKSVFKHTGNFHVYLVHNTPDSVSLKVGEKYAQEYPDHITVFTNTENLGLVGGINSTYKKAIKHKRVCILNSDCVVTKGWLAQMSKEMDDDPTISQISPDSNSFYPPRYLGRILRMLPGKLSRLQILEIYLGQAARSAQPGAFQQVQYFFDFCPGFCHLFDSKHFKDLGYFADPNVVHGYWDDLDFSCHLRQFGKIGSTQKAYVYHFLGSSFKLLKKESNPDTEMLKRINGLYVMHKWREFFRTELEKWGTTDLISSLGNPYLRNIVEYFGVADIKLELGDYLLQKPAQEYWDRITQE